jgi:hypothetical protein
MTLRTVLLLTLVLAAGATAGPALGQEPPNPTDPSIADGSAERALDRARATWKRAKLRSYDFQARRSCFCPTTGWHTLKVRHGVARRPYAADVQEIATVPRLFKVIQAAIDARAHRLTVSYGAHGVPRRIYVDRIANVIDEEQTFSIRRFKAR